MIKYLTEKLKQHTLDDDRAVNKVKESDYDSGTESDDQNAAMEREECDRSSAPSGLASGRSSLVTPASSPYFLDSALPSDCDLTYDHHSSEEELEVINGSSDSCDKAKRTNRSPYGNSRCRSVSSALPEKRKWSEVMDAEPQGEQSTAYPRPRVRISTRRHASSSDENMYAGEDASRKCISTCSSGASSDDETAPNGAFAPIAPSTPVNFSRSPPLNAHKPPTRRSLSPPLKMLNCDSTTVDQQRSQSVLSPRYKRYGQQRHRLTPTQRMHHAHNIQRPCLDFEKMQQMKENAVTTWRHHSNGEHGGELSLFCW